MPTSRAVSRRSARRRLLTILRYRFVTIDEEGNEVPLAVDDDFTPQGEAIDVGDTALLPIGGVDRPWKIADKRTRSDEVTFIVEPPSA